MNLQLTGHHVEITPPIREYVSSKLERITHHFDHLIEVNVILMLLNLLPILPLDGGRIVAGLLPRRIALRYARLEPWGFPILLLLLFTSALGVILAPMISFSYRVIGTMFQI